MKLTDEQQTDIIALHGQGESQHELARLFKVSRRTISFILFPERLEANKQRRKERGGWKQYYNKEKHRVAMKDHRHYKQGLYVAGALT